MKIFLEIGAQSWDLISFQVFTEYVLISMRSATVQVEAFLYVYEWNLHTISFSMVCNMLGLALQGVAKMVSYVLNSGFFVKISVFHLKSRLRVPLKKKLKIKYQK